MRASPVLALLAAALLGGCFNWRPITDTMPAQGASLEAVLSDSGSLALTGRIGPNAASILGTLAGVSADTVLISIAEVRTRDGLSYYLKGTTVGVARSHMAQLRVRELDRRRTTVAAIAGVVGAAAIAGSVQLLGGGSDNTGGGGGTPAMRPPE